MAVKRSLGRGLNVLIRDDSPKEPVAPAPAKSEPAAAGRLLVNLDKIRKNDWQPRHEFDATAHEELVASVREHGILQPLLVRPEGEAYQLIAGERRLRAATAVGLKQVPVTVVNTSDTGALELALVENLQRQDLNIIEEADGYKLLADRFGMTQERISERVGKSRAAVANALRVLALPEEIRRMLIDGRLSAGHAKVIAGLDSAEDQLLCARKAANDGLSVRQLELLVKKAATAPAPATEPKATKDDMPAGHVNYLSDKLHGHFGTAVRLTPCRTYANGKKAKGTIEIDFYSNEDLDRVLQVIGVNLE